jgi:DNA-binding MarR family transcriptional regulator
VKNIFKNFSKAFESRARLGIMSILMVNESIDFNSLKELLNLSDGNIASHIKALEELGFLNVNKQFIGKKPNTKYMATKIGRKAFTDHLNALENIIKENGKQKFNR